VPIIIISGASHSAEEEIALSLEKKTGWPLLSRKEVVERARAQGIEIGRFEAFIIKSPIISKKMAKEKELYLAFVNKIVCESVKEGNLIYRSRAGHLILPGVTHRLRVGLMAPREMRIANTMRELRLPREKAEVYLNKLDEDFNKWVRFVYHIESMDLSRYDFFINLQNVSLANVSATLCNIAELPDFQPTPRSMKLTDDLYLAARAKVRLYTDKRTRNFDLLVRAGDGVVTVTYIPRRKGEAEAILEVLKGLKRCTKIRCTMAETHILWVQESFTPHSENFEEITKIASRWNSAVELMRVAPKVQQIQASAKEQASGAIRPIQGARPEIYTGGVKKDSLEREVDDKGLAQTIGELASIGRSAGGQTIYGGKDIIIESIKGHRDYSLVVLGDLFLASGHEARLRQVQELELAIRERVRAPVISDYEMKSRFLFGKKQALSLFAFAALVICVYTLVFYFQDPILNFLAGDIHKEWKLLASVSVALFVPFIAYCYSTFTGLIFKLVGVD